MTYLDTNEFYQELHLLSAKTFIILYTLRANARQNGSDIVTHFSFMPVTSERCMLFMLFHCHTYIHEHV